MRITVKLFASLTRFKSGMRSGTPFEIDLPEGAVVKDLFAHLLIPTEETKVVFINNIIQDHDTPLREGDVVGVFPPVGGG